MKEEWKTTNNGHYEVSNNGKVRRLARGRGARRGRMRKLQLHPNGYYIVDLYVDSIRTHRPVHQLVAEAFIGPRPEGYDINHKDGVKTNNIASNLEYVTRSGNCLHAYRMNLNRGPERIPQATVDRIHVLHSQGQSLRSIAKILNVSDAYCSLVTRGKMRVRRRNK